MMLNKAKKLQKSLNPKKPKCTREACALDINASFNNMTQKFAEYIQYFQA